VRYREVVARLHGHVASAQADSVVGAVLVLLAELVPVAVREALDRQRVHVAPVDAAQERRHRRQLALRQRPAPDTEHTHTHTVGGVAYSG